MGWHERRTFGGLPPWRVAKPPNVRASCCYVHKRGGFLPRDERKPPEMRTSGIYARKLRGFSSRRDGKPPKLRACPLDPILVSRSRNNALTAPKRKDGNDKDSDGKRYRQREQTMRLMQKEVQANGCVRYRLVPPTREERQGAARRQHSVKARTCTRERRALWDRVCAVSPSTKRALGQDAPKWPKGA